MYRPSKLALISTCVSAFLLAAALLLAAPTPARADQGTKTIESTMTITMQKSSDGGAAEKDATTGGAGSGDAQNPGDQGSPTTGGATSGKTPVTGEAPPLALAVAVALCAGAACCLLKSRKLSFAQGAHMASGPRGAKRAGKPRDTGKRALSLLLAAVLATGMCLGFATKASAAEGGTDPDAEAAEAGDELPDLDVECTANVVIDEEGNVLSADFTLINDSDYIIDVSDIAAPEELEGWEAAFDYLYWDEDGGSWDEDINSWFEDDDEYDYWGDDEYDYSDDLAELSAADEAVALSDDAALASDDSAAPNAMVAAVKPGARATGAWRGGMVPSSIVDQVRASGSASLTFHTGVYPDFSMLRKRVIFDANAPDGTTATIDGKGATVSQRVRYGTKLTSSMIPEDSAVKCSNDDYVFVGWSENKDASASDAKKHSELAAAYESIRFDKVYYAVWARVNPYWLNVANADDPTKNVLKHRFEIAEDMEVLHGTKAQTSAGKDKAAVIAEYTNYMNGKSADGTTDQEVRLYTKWNGDDAGDGANRWVEFRVIQVGEHDGDGSAVTFMATHSLPTAKYMNYPESNAGSWESSQMRKDTMTNYVKAGLSGLCKDDESTGAKTITKVTTSGGWDGYGSWIEGSTTSDQFWLLSHTEVFGTDGNRLVRTYFKAEGTQYAWFANKGVNARSGWDSLNPAIRKMTQTRAGGDPAGCEGTFWWLRSPSVSDSRYFGRVSFGGRPLYSIETNVSGGVVPAFSM